MFALHPAAEIPVKTNVFPPPNAISLFPPFYFRPMRRTPRPWCVYKYTICVYCTVNTNAATTARVQVYAGHSGRGSDADGSVLL